MARRRTSESDAPASFQRLSRPLTLGAQVEHVLRQAILEGRFGSGKIPTEVELADQLGVSRETVRLAAEVLQREGLLVKIRRKGTFVQREPAGPMKLRDAPTKVLGYLQAKYQSHGEEEGVLRATSGLMLQGALEEAGRAGFQLIVQEAAYTELLRAFQQILQTSRLDGVLFVSYGEEKLLKRVAGQGLPIVLVDHDLHLPQINSVRDDSYEGARHVVHFLADRGHRRIAFAAWHQTDLNPWRLRGYRQGLRDRGLVRRRQWEIPTELTDSGARALVEAWLALEPRPTALYCFNNTLARLVIEELLRRDMRVPEHLSVIGGGGEEIPGLTCHQADWRQIGARGVQILLRALKQGEGHRAEHLLIAHSLREGGTVGQGPPR
jgi:DNA-binding LacI/PurR family transcriptional regulator/biotin operon repressor